MFRILINNDRNTPILCCDYYAEHIEDVREAIAIWAKPEKQEEFRGV